VIDVGADLRVRPFYTDATRVHTTEMVPVHLLAISFTPPLQRGVRMTQRN